MRILIAYATKTGTTEDAAKRLQAQLTQQGATVVLANLSNTVPNLSSFDAMIIGFPIRMGQIHKHAKRFLLAMHSTLIKKPFALFCCRCGRDNLNTILSQKLGEELFSCATQVASFGGEIRIEKQKGIDLWITKSPMASTLLADMDHSGLNDQSISAFAAAFLEGNPIV